MANTYDPAQDPYAQRSVAVDSQARNGFVVTPSDSANLAPYAKALYIGSAGDLTIVPIGAADDSQTLLLANHPVGYCAFQVRRVMAAGTNAGNIIALTA